LAAMRRDVAASGRIALHGDGATGEQEMNHPKPLGAHRVIPSEARDLGRQRPERRSRSLAPLGVTVLRTDLNHPHSTLPPFTLTTSPVTCRARSLQRKRIGPAMSSGGGIRRSGMVASTRPRPSPAKAGMHISVSTQPGATQVTRMAGAEWTACDC